MGFGGFGIAIAVLFLLVYFAPYLMRTRQMLIDAPIDERYVEDLRMITCRTQIPSEARGRIFLTERTMATAQTDKLRAAARDRSRARARMATRRVNQARGFVIGGAIGVLSVILWIAVAVTTLPVAVAIASTVVGGIYAFGFGYLVNVMNQADEEDRERIEKANLVLGAAKRPKSVSFEPVKSVAKKSALKKSDVETATPAKTSVVEAPVAKVEKAEGQQPDVSAETDVVKDLAPTAPTHSAVPAPREVRVATPAPSYTIKPSITKRTVKPYVAPQQATVENPYRPTKVGERIGDEVLEAANEAPVMTGNEELRSDVLGGGSTLDALLERRRA